MVKKRLKKGIRPDKVIIYRELCCVEEFAGALDKNDDQYLVHKGVVIQKVPHENFRIDTSQIPNHVCDDLAAATLDFVRRMMQDPETREEVKARIRAKKDM